MKYNYGIASGYGKNNDWIGIQYWTNSKTQSIYYKDREIYHKGQKTRVSF